MCQTTAAARPDRKTLNQGQNWITQAKRLAIYVRDGFACCYCGRGVEVKGLVLTLEHVVPYAEGGALLDPTNLVTACRNCNSARGKKKLTTFVNANAEKWERTPASILSYIRRHRQMPLDLKATNKLIKARGTCRKVLDLVAQGDKL